MRAAIYALVMSDESRLGRQAIETAYARKQTALCLNCCHRVLSMM